MLYCGFLVCFWLVFGRVIVAVFVFNAKKTEAVRYLAQVEANFFACERVVRIADDFYGVDFAVVVLFAVLELESQLALLRKTNNISK